MSESATTTLPASSWMTLQQAGELLGAHTNTVRRWVDSGVIGSYRTLGGHRRLARQDVRALAKDSAQSTEANFSSDSLAKPAAELVSATLHGDLSARECRMRLRQLGRELGREASAGMRLPELLASHASTRRAIADLIRREASFGLALDERRVWADSLADALLLGLSEGMDTIPERANAIRARRTG
jgi:excisionase family DNA binding protein